MRQNFVVFERVDTCTEETLGSMLMLILATKSVYRGNTDFPTQQTQTPAALHDPTHSQTQTCALLIHVLWYIPSHCFVLQ